MQPSKKRRYPKISGRIRLWVSDPFTQLRRQVEGTVFENDYRTKRCRVRLDEQPEGVHFAFDPAQATWEAIPSPTPTAL